MSEIGAVVGFFILQVLLWSRISAEQRQAERKSRFTPQKSVAKPGAAMVGGHVECAPALKRRLRIRITRETPRRGIQSPG
jgi:hypothetical protein